MKALRIILAIALVISLTGLLLSAEQCQDVGEGKGMGGEIPANAIKFRIQSDRADVLCTIYKGLDVPIQELIPAGTSKEIDVTGYGGFNFFLLAFGDTTICWELIGPPASPSNLRASAVSRSRIDIRWSDKSENEEGFEIQRKRSGGSFSTIATVRANTTSYSDTGLSCGTTYYYRVRAYNDAGNSSWSNEDYTTTYSCPPVCGNGKCESGEDCHNCPRDCGPCHYCGDGHCDPDESCNTCPQDCGPCHYCGDGHCDWDENSCNCPQDCPGPCGGDPPIWGNIIAFPTPERFLGRDLNGDGDTDDTVLRYMNIKTGEVVNTGALVSGLVHSVDIYENIIVFVGKNSSIRYYEIATGAFGDIGAQGSRPSIYGNIIAFSSGGTIHYYDLGTRTLVNTGINGTNPAIYKNIIAFESYGKIQLYDLRSGILVDTDIMGNNPALYENIIVFETRESLAGQDLNGDGDTADTVIRYYDVNTGELINTRESGSLPSIYRNIIVFSTAELAVDKDLDRDGRIGTFVIRYYDIASGRTINTGKPGTEPDIYDGTISFYNWEPWVNQDLNCDGDMSDPIVHYYRIAQEVARVESQKVMLSVSAKETSGRSGFTLFSF